jgi:hypothetical protein
VTATAAYTLTQADVDRGYVANAAWPSATVPGGQPMNNPDPHANDPWTTPAGANLPSCQVAGCFVQKLNPAPQLTIDKSADPLPDGWAVAGMQVTYRFTVTNSGPVTMNAVSVNDYKFSGTGKLGTLTWTWPDAKNPGTLAPGQQASATAPYTLTAADTAAGWIANAAVPTGVSASGQSYAPSPAADPWTSPTDGTDPVCAKDLSGCVVTALPAPPKSEATKSTPKSPIEPQFSAPMMTRISEAVSIFLPPNFLIFYRLGLLLSLIFSNIHKKQILHRFLQTLRLFLINKTIFPRLN